MRALEMSMNALAVTELLMSRGSNPPLDQNPNAYGSITVPNVPSSSNTPFRRPNSEQNAPINSSMMGPPNAATLASNLWGVPEESTIMENESDDELERVEEGQANNGHDLPPSAFNV